MEIVSEKKLKKMNIDFPARGRKRNSSPVYQVISSLNIGECAIYKEDEFKTMGIGIRSLRCFISSNKRKELDPNMMGKKFSCNKGSIDGENVFVVKRIK